VALARDLPSTYPIRVLSSLSVYLAEQRLTAKVYFVCPPPGKLESDPTSREFLRDIRQKRFSAVAIIQGMLPEAARELMEQNGVPVVWNSVLAAERYAVGGDYLQTLREGTRRLLEQECRKIAWLEWDHPQTPRLARDAALQAFQSVLSDFGAVARPEWIRGDLHPSLEGAGYEEFREIWTGRSEKPDGLLVMDDVLFQDVVTAIEELRIDVPSQLKVVATANKGTVTCPLFPATRMEVDPAAAGQAVGEMVAQLVRGETPEPRHVAVPFRWVEPVTQGTVEDQSCWPRSFGQG